MGALTSIAASRAFAAPAGPSRPRVQVADAAALQGDSARPSRVGGAPLSGTRATTAYQRTAAVESLTVLSRVDEYA
jgi:hypothetical protein